MADATKAWFYGGMLHGERRDIAEGQTEVKVSVLQGIHQREVQTMGGGTHLLDEPTFLDVVYRRVPKGVMYDPPEGYVPFVVEDWLAKA